MQAGMRDTSLTGSIHVIQCHPAAQARSKVAAIELAERVARAAQPHLPGGSTTAGKPRNAAGGVVTSDD
jgi:hypothetical protein